MIAWKLSERERELKLEWRPRAWGAREPPPARHHGNAPAEIRQLPAVLTERYTGAIKRHEAESSIIVEIDTSVALTPQ